MASSLAYSEILEPMRNNKTKRNREGLLNNSPNKTKITTDYLKEKVEEINPFNPDDEEEQEDNINDIFPEKPQPARMITKDYTDGLLNKNKNDYGIPLSKEKEESPDKNYFIQNNMMESFETNGTVNNEDELNRKLSYLIHLIEDQHDEKIKSVTEEVILYGFLGVFIIYVLDSFTKIGKYVR